MTQEMQADVGVKPQNTLIGWRFKKTNSVPTKPQVVDAAVTERSNQSETAELTLDLYKQELAAYCEKISQFDIPVFISLFQSDEQTVVLKYDQLVAEGEKAQQLSDELELLGKKRELVETRLSPELKEILVLFFHDLKAFIGSISQFYSQIMPGAPVSELPAMIDDFFELSSYADTVRDLAKGYDFIHETVNTNPIALNVAVKLIDKQVSGFRNQYHDELSIDFDVATLQPETKFFSQFNHFGVTHLLTNVFSNANRIYQVAQERGLFPLHKSVRLSLEIEENAQQEQFFVLTISDDSKLGFPDSESVAPQVLKGMKVKPYEPEYGKTSWRNATTVKGTGTGLAGMKAYFDSIGGELAAYTRLDESDTPEGATIVVRVPLRHSVQDF